MSAASAYRRGSAPLPGPTPGFLLGVETAATNQVRTYSLPGLVSATEATVLLVASKPPSTEDLRMLCAILSQDGTTKTDVAYVGRSYSPNAGLAANTYTNGFSGVQDKTVLDGGRTVLIGAELIAVGASAGGFAFRVGGQPQPLAHYDVHQPRVWGSTFFLGGEQAGAYTWPGTILACYVYPRRLRPDEYLRTERYLRARFPQIA
ncbi:hypothetical protein [Hymenobacter cheonanensis]|uniref:hypothetical protein n=1 Tax=Hymenobacter sp. CA2-7 TaxID=3063993 RepID=UPI0027143EF3|nr:hypothetical protein [Hymenobacter sp. CA2-7]MDO7885343.1 hypothetical protein [Hymenobacter sp. CA2-7]